MPESSTAALRARRAIRIGRSVIREYFADDMPTHAAALAFHALFAVAPFLLFLLALLSFFDAAVVFQWIREGSEQLLPSAPGRPVERVIAEVRDRRQSGLLSFGILSALWFASAGIRATMTALNVAFDLEEERSVWKRYLLSVAYTVALAVLVTLATLLFALGPSSIAWLGERAGMDASVVTAWTWLRLPAVGFIAVLSAAVIFHVAPNLDQRFRVLSPGSVVTAALWGAGAAGLNYYLANHAHLSSTHGSLGTGVALLLFFYLSALVLLLGGELNAELLHGSRRRDRTKAPGNG